MIEDPISRMATYALIPTLATIFGSAIVFLRSSVDERFVDASLGFGSGLMVYVAFIELLIPSLEIGSLGLTLAGFFVGFFLIKVLDVLLPHSRIVRTDKSRSLTLVALAIAIHNIPEGLAVGSTSLYSNEAGLATALAIAIQDVPEGFIVSLSVVAVSGKALTGFAVGAMSAASEFIAALSSVLGLVSMDILLPSMLAISASAMIYVVIHEVAPEIFGHEHDEYATAGFLAGLLMGIVL